MSSTESPWVGRLVKTLEEVSQRGKVVEDRGEYVMVEFQSEFGKITRPYNKMDLQFID